MASPNTYKVESPDIGSVPLHLVMTFGASGAVASYQAKKEFAVTPVSHASTGTYTVTMREGWIALLDYNANNVQATYSTSGACQVDLKPGFSVSTGSFTFEFRTNAGSLVDPASGDQAFLTLVLQREKPASTP